MAHVDEAMQALRTFAAAREWAPFHTPANLAKSISIEAGELLEHFQWDEDFDAEAVELELADVLTYAYFLADKLGVDPEELILKKLAITEQKYPVEKARGRSTKYDALDD